MTEPQAPPQDPTSTPQEAPQAPQQGLDTDTLMEMSALAHEALRHVLGTLGRPSEIEIANALYQVLEPYPAGASLEARYATLALLDGRLMLVIDHEAWAYQVFTVASLACPLPHQPAPQPAPQP